MSLKDLPPCIRYFVSTLEMAAIRVVVTARENSEDIHLLPCCIDLDGEAERAKDFFITVPEGSGSPHLFDWQDVSLIFPRKHKSLICIYFPDLFSLNYSVLTLQQSEPAFAGACFGETRWI
jgi:hypothetical protein